VRRTIFFNPGSGIRIGGHFSLTNIEPYFYIDICSIHYWFQWFGSMEQLN
jgi:hypothetical protein